MSDKHEVLDAISGTDDECALATVIKVEGSAYRKEETSMLFTKAGKQIGMISAGCLEEDLALRADRLLNEGDKQAYTIVYDMSAEDDLSWGRGAGCNGKVHVLLERINPGYKQDLLQVKKLLENGIDVTALKVVAKDNVGTVFVSKNQHVFGNKQTITKLVNEMPKTNEPGIVKNAEASLFVHQFKPKPRLFIFGAGPDVQPLVHIAEQTGFAVNIWDWRPALLNRERFPNARLMEGGMIGAIDANRFTKGDSAVIMTHDFQRDREILQRMLEQKQISYLGILGPRKRTSRLLDHKPIPDFLRSPVGIEIGAEGPEEIAVSIVAELIQTQRLAEEG